MNSEEHRGFAIEVGAFAEQLFMKYGEEDLSNALEKGCKMNQAFDIEELCGLSSDKFCVILAASGLEESPWKRRSEKLISELIGSAFTFRPSNEPLHAGVHDNHNHIAGEQSQKRVATPIEQLPVKSRRTESSPDPGLDSVETPELRDPDTEMCENSPCAWDQQQKSEPAVRRSSGNDDEVEEVVIKKETDSKPVLMLQQFLPQASFLAQFKGADNMGPPSLFSNVVVVFDADGHVNGPTKHVLNNLFLFLCMCLTGKIQANKEMVSAYGEVLVQNGYFVKSNAGVTQKEAWSKVLRIAASNRRSLNDRSSMSTLWTFGFSTTSGGSLVGFN